MGENGMGFMQCSVHADSRPFSHSLPPFCKPTQRQLTDHRIPVEPHSDGCSLDGGLLSAYNCDLLDQSSLFALDLACLVLAGQGLLHAVVSLAGPDGTPHIGQSFPVQDLAVRKVTGRLDPADREKGRGDAWASCRESDSHPGVYVRPSRSIQHRGQGAFSPFTHPSFLTAVELAVLAITWGNSSPNAPFGGAASGFLFTEVFAPNTMSLQSRREAELLCQCLP